MALSGHLWTLSGYLRRSLSASAPPHSRAWSIRVADADLGSVRLTGKLSLPPRAQDLVVVVHGLGGSCESPYVVEAAARMVESGFACLRLNLRGADRSGEDIYHAGLTVDLSAAVASRRLERFDRVAVLGFSLGGHLALRFALDNPPARLCSTVAICPPVDLAAVAASIDRRSRWPYRRYLLRRLVEIHAAVARRRRVSSSIEEVRAATTFVEFDSRVIAPRWGFSDAQEYYRSVSVGPDLRRLGVPTLVIAAVADPMVPAASLRRHAAVASNRLTLVWSRSGGHLSFPREVNFGLASRAGLYPQVVGWLRRSLEV